MICRSDFYSISARLQCYLLKGPLKREILNHYLTTFFGVRKFKNTSAMMVTFFSKMLRLNLNFENARKTSKKVFCF